MKPKIRIAVRRSKTLIRLTGIAFLLMFYAAGVTQTGFLHQLFHPGEMAVSHSVKQEKDPCHRALFHGADNGCRHEFHLVKVHSCGLCHTLAHSDLLLFDPAFTGSPVGSDKWIALSSGRCHVDVYHSFLTRGPPAALRA